jgi:repressor LexA
MNSLSHSQQQVLNFILSWWEAGKALPSAREIGGKFGWSSPKAATDALAVLKRKGLLASDPGSGRKYRLTERASGLPVLGEIPAGNPIEALPEHDEYFAFSLASFGIQNRADSFLLRVKGDSMIGRQIFDGDLVLVEKSGQPNHRDIVAALIDREVTLKTFSLEHGQACLRSENPAYPDPVPSQELQIQGIARGVIRPLNR